MISERLFTRKPVRSAGDDVDSLHRHDEQKRFSAPRVA
jgi:hypothetical protein